MPVYCLELTDGQFVDFPRGGGVRTQEIQSIYSRVVEEYLKAHAADSLLIN